MLDGVQGASRIPELRRRVVFTLLMLAVYRVGVAVPTPGIDSEAVATLFDRAGGVVDTLNLLSGGAFERFSVFALGIMPYISSSIILQLLTVVVPYLERLSKEGEAGRRKITQYTRYSTIVLALGQALAISVGLETLRAPNGGAMVFEPGWSFRIMTMLTLTTGTSFLMWMGEQISERGIGNGISLIIFAGIVANLWSALSSTYEFVRTGELGILVLLFVAAVAVVTIGCVTIMERGQRRIPVQYAKRMVGRRVYAGQSSHLPLKINVAGVIPAIFASSLLMLPSTFAAFFDQPWAKSIQNYLNPSSGLYNLVYTGLIIFFCYFYTAIQFNTVDVADNMKKSGGYIPGIRPGQRTAEFIDRILARLTLGGALYLAAVCVLPTLLISQFNVPFYFGGTALLIVVGVALDTVAQMETHMLTRNYQGFMRRGRIRGRRG